MTKQSRSTPVSKQTQRLDLLLVERGLVASREQARRLIMAGEVLVNDQVSDKPGRSYPREVDVRVRKLPQYVSRGGLKLASALEEFHLDVTGLVAVDVGASTGGFTDCLLQQGATRVYAVDVGYGQLAWKLRNDPRVVVLERTNVRYLTRLRDNTLADLAVIDASFISLALVLPPTLALLNPEGQVIALIKPQFEAGKDQVGKGGVVREERVLRRVLEDVLRLSRELDLTAIGLIPSPLLGPAGNVEFLVHLRKDGGAIDPGMDLISPALEQARALRRG